MYLLDTNILSEARRRDPAATAWLTRNRDADMFLSVVTLGEITKGIAMLARRDETAARALEEWLQRLIAIYASRILPVDQRVMMEWGRIAAIRPRGDLDAIIAATARVNNLVLVTRNIRDFADLDLAIVDPWAA